MEVSKVEVVGVSSCVGTGVMVGACRIEVVVGVGAWVGTGVMVGAWGIKAVVEVNANVGMGVVMRVPGELLSGIA
jgi:hypothetical protein